MPVIQNNMKQSVEAITSINREDRDALKILS